MALFFSKQENPSYDPRVAFIQAVLGLSSSDIDGKFGPTTELKVKSFQSSNEIPPDGRVDERTGRTLRLPYWDAQIVRELDPPFRDPDKFPAGHQFAFRSSHEGGHFAHDPKQFISGDPRTKRAVRTNNPGALNISAWQKAMPGYVGRTQADNSASANKTTIYLAPEDGVQAWYTLIVHRYEQLFHLISHGTGSTINIRRLAKTYGLGAPDKADNALSNDERDVVNSYLAGWKKWSTRPPRTIVLEASTEIDPNNTAHMLTLASAMFSHEASLATPLLDVQMEDGINRARAPHPMTSEEADMATATQAEVASSLERFQSVLGRLRSRDAEDE
jgi:D-alanyl-D-alanine carboxypeptidase